MGIEDKTLADLLGEMQHFCVVVDNIDRAIDFFSKMGYKFGEIRIIKRSGTIILRGKPVSYIFKGANAKNIKPALELTEVVEGEATQKEILEKNGPCIHHLCYSTSDLNEVIAKFKKLGIEAVQILKDPSSPTRFAMIDLTKICGYYIEVTEHRR